MSHAVTAVADGDTGRATIEAQDPEGFAAAVCDAIRAADPDYVFVLVSGGHDSIATLYRVYAELGGRIDAVVHVNTGIGVAATREFVGKHAARLGLAYIEGLTPKREERYGQLVLEFGFPGPPGHPYRPLKERVLDGLYSAFGGDLVYVTGARRHESDRRMETVSAVGLERKDRRTRTLWAAPLAEHTGADVNRVLDAYGVERNEAADVLGMSGECLCMAYGQFWDLAYVVELDPALAIGIVLLMSLANQYWRAHREEHGEPPFPRQYLVWGHGGVGRGALSYMVNGTLDDPDEFSASDVEQRAEDAREDDGQPSLSDVCRSCARRAAQAEVSARS